MDDLVFVEQHPVAGRTVEIGSGCTIGREGCDVLLPDPEVSRRHAVVRVADGVASVEDVGSTNGTWLNGRRVEGRAELRAGDELRLGNTVWHVRPRRH